MNNTNADLHQELMNVAYDFWKGSELSRTELLSIIPGVQKAAVQLGNLNYQVCNGGFVQWDFNEYSEDIDDLIELAIKGVELGLPTFSTILELLNDFKDKPEYNEDTEEVDCSYCDGSGTVSYDTDDEDNEIEEDCEDCGGDGWYTDETNNHSEIIEYLDALDERYYALGWSDILSDMNKLLEHLITANTK